jgi:pyrophosphate--fructose-6-phosphate 1-phosphotransferase
VELEGAPFRAFDAIRDLWAAKTCYLIPGSIQYFGPPEVADQPTRTLKLEHGGGASL